MARAQRGGPRSVRPEQLYAMLSTSKPRFASSGENWNGRAVNATRLESKLAYRPIVVSLRAFSMQHFSGRARHDSCGRTQLRPGIHRYYEHMSAQEVKQIIRLPLLRTAGFRYPSV